MKRTTPRAVRGLGLCALASTLALSSCGGQTPDSRSIPGGGDVSASAGTFGPGCEQVPTSGRGSFAEMATQPVATAADDNPLLTTLVRAVTRAGLAQPLNSAAELTVFAPTDAAFAALPRRRMRDLMSRTAPLSKLLSHHVVRGQLAPDQLDGEHTTLAGDIVTVSGAGADFSVGDPDDASILCGGIKTSNATVYIIDKVLMPEGR